MTNMPSNINTPTVSRLPRGDGEIAYESAGSGPLILCVPGIGDLRQSYRHLTPLLVSRGYRVVTTDLRGHGDSDASFASYGDEETASDIQALLTHLGEPAVIVGNSMGAGSAVIVSADSPELVNALVLVGPFVRDTPGGGAAKLLFRILMARPWAAPVWRAYLPSLYAGARPGDFAQYRNAVSAAMARPGYTRAFSLTTRLTHAGAERALSSVEAPTLIVMGEKDPDFRSPAAEAEWIGQKLRGSTVMVPEAGHYPQSQQPAVVADAITGFLAEQRA